MMMVVVVVVVVVVDVVGSNREQPTEGGRVR